MKKITLVCLATDTTSTLESLRKTGVLHLNHLQSPKSRDLDHARQTAQAFRKAFEALPASKGAKLSSSHPLHTVERVNKALEDKREATEKLTSLRRARDKLIPFGDFDPETIHFLHQNGVTVKLYIAEPKQRLTAPEGTYMTVLSKNKTGVYCAVIGTGDYAIEAREIPVPARSLTQINNEIKYTETLYKEAEKQLAELGRYRDSLAGHIKHAEAEVRFHEARAGMGDAGEVSIIQGYCPVDVVDGILEAAASNGWAYRLEDPAPDEEIPTLIRNPHWIELIRPVFDFVGVVPGYKEVDISVFFLFFLSLFYALIVGDAGYGFIFLIIAIAGRLKFKKTSGIFFVLLTEMSILTIIWGVLTGNYFGIPTRYAPFPQLHVQWLDDQNHIIILCFIIGAVHLTLAHGWHFIRRFPDWTSYAQLGWICTTWTMFFAARSMLLGASFPQGMYVILGIGMVLILVFMMHPRNISQEWFNLVVFPLSLVSNFVDLVSYIRLFAVGMATYAVASAFNMMSMEIGFNSIITGVEAVLVLLFGHILNITLASMGVLVHGIRLNVLEFSTHLGMEWTGTKYDPFAQMTEMMHTSTRDEPYEI